MSERFWAMNIILVFYLIVMVTLLLWGFDLAAAVAAAGGASVFAVEAAIRLLGKGDDPGSGSGTGDSPPKIRPA